MIGGSFLGTEEESSREIFRSENWLYKQNLLFRDFKEPEDSYMQPAEVSSRLNDSRAVSGAYKSVLAGSYVWPQ